ncbi:MAG: hypothetical protein ACETVR_01490 [Candidatus Bathyarchaeia archaeon]
MSGGAKPWRAGGPDLKYFYIYQSSEMDIENLFKILWNVTVIVAILAFTLGFVFIATGGGEAERRD